MSDLEETLFVTFYGAVSTALPMLCSMTSSILNILEMLKSYTLIVSCFFELNLMLVSLRSVWMMPLL